jgi:class 3 adenylate cyclase
VPLAPNAPPPAPLSRTNGATAGISDLRHVIRAGLRALKASDPGTYRRYDIARRGLKLLRRGDIDRDVIDQLGGAATLWSPDLRTFTLTARVADPGRMARALNGLKPLMGRLLAAAGLSGARYGVAGDTFVATTTPGPSLAQLAAGSPARIDSLTGAVTGVIRASVLRQTLIDRLGLPPIASLALGALGDATFSVRTATTGVDAGADVSIR